MPDKLTQSDIAAALVETVRARIEIVAHELRQMGPGVRRKALADLETVLHLAACRVREIATKGD